jgi:prevent-host-death family protein
MSLPKRSRRGEVHTITMMELRKQPGEVIEAIRDGAVVRITKQGRHIATIVPPGDDPTPITIQADGQSADGRMPITWRRPDLLAN